MLWSPVTGPELNSIHVEEEWVSIPVTHTTAVSILVVALVRLGFGDWQTAFAAGGLFAALATHSKLNK